MKNATLESSRAAALVHRQHLRELDQSCNLCKEFIVGEINEETWLQRTGLAVDYRSRWRKFVDAISLNSRCEDVIIPGYGGRGVSYVYQGCGCSGGLHMSDRCKHDWCHRVYNSPMA
jgi:hypothetical protein